MPTQRTGLPTPHDLSWDGTADPAAIRADLDKLRDLLANSLRHLETLSLGMVEAIRNSPPPAPSDGDAFVIGAAPTGAWNGAPNLIAYWDDGAGDWRFQLPADHQTIWVRELADAVQFLPATDGPRVAGGRWDYSG